MRYLIPITLVLICFSSCKHDLGHGHHGKDLEIEDFDSKKVTKSAVIKLNGNIDKVFPLFNPIEEQKWAPEFKPHFIYPGNNKIQEGMSFKTAGHGDEPEFLWVITKYNQDDHLIQYLVSTANRYWFITVNCNETTDNLESTTAEISYAYYALNETGLKLNKFHLERMYEKNLKDWEEAVNNYLKD